MDCVKNIKILAQEVPPQFISSAGIRVLVMQYKNLQALNGMFYIRVFRKCGAGARDGGYGKNVQCA